MPSYDMEPFEEFFGDMKFSCEQMDVVQWTAWMLESPAGVVRWIVGSVTAPQHGGRPAPVGLHYHSYVRVANSDTEKDDCRWLAEGKCFYGARWAAAQEWAHRWDGSREWIKASMLNFHNGYLLGKVVGQVPVINKGRKDFSSRLGRLLGEEET